MLICFGRIICGKCEIFFFHLSRSLLFCQHYRKKRFRRVGNFGGKINPMLAVCALTFVKKRNSCSCLYLERESLLWKFPFKDFLEKIIQLFHANKATLSLEKKNMREIFWTHILLPALDALEVEKHSAPTK